MRFDILTLFPELFAPHISASVIGRGREEGLLDVQVHNIRDYATDKHRTVDDTPYGGGAGMVMKVEPIDKALQSVTSAVSPPDKGGKGGSLATPAGTPSRSPFKGGGQRIVVLAARGEQFTQAKAQEYAQLDQLVLICGRYEGIDQRVADHLADEELSIGPYVLAGGDVAAMVVLEAVARLVPGVLGNPESLEEESFAVSSPDKGRPGGFNAETPSGSPLSGGETTEYPQYTKPADYKGWQVPEVLLSGNHEEIKKWRESQRGQDGSQP